MSEQESAREGLLIPSGWLGKTEAWVFGAIAVISVSRVTPFIYEDQNVRDQLPEPLDVFDHVGNLSISYSIVALGSHMYNGTDMKLISAEQNENRSKGFAAMAGVATVAANVFAEKVGYGPSSTADVLDFAYGCFGGLLAYKLTRPRYLEPGVVEIIDTEDLETSDFSAQAKDNVRLYRAKLWELRQKREAETTTPTIPSSKITPKNKPVAASTEKHLKNKRRRQQRKKRNR